ncbi:MAG: hypothetical protein ACI90V_009766 [Bacillariaceae sp.]|jgi:hypothetical protein
MLGIAKGTGTAKKIKRRRIRGKELVEAQAKIQMLEQQLAEV